MGEIKSCKDCDNHRRLLAFPNAFYCARYEPYIFSPIVLRAPGGPCGPDAVGFKPKAANAEATTTRGAK